MSEIAKFNIGGHRYEVSRSLLQSHPDTMLAKSASDQWQKDPESEIFIERDGQRFRFVLDYLRDGKVGLPINETTDAFVAELEYYNIDVDMDKINREVKVEDAILARDCILDRLEETVKSFQIQHLQLQESAKHSAIKNRCAEIALFCCRGALRERKSIDGRWYIRAGNNNTYIENGGKECYARVVELKKHTTDTQVLMDNVNHFLKDHRLELWLYEHSGSVMTFFIKDSDEH